MSLSPGRSHKLWLAVLFASRQHGADNDVCNGGGYGIAVCVVTVVQCAVFGGASPGGRPLECSSHAGGGAALSKLDFIVRKGIG